MFNKGFILKSISHRISNLNERELDEMERYFYDNNMMLVRDLFLEAKRQKEHERLESGSECVKNVI
jgi:hypothetical protein